MKKRLFIYPLAMSVSCLLCISLAAQQQKKPSERSFTEEVNRMKQLQLLQRSRLPRQQPDNSLGSNTTNTQLPDQSGLNAVTNPNNKMQTGKPQQLRLKPSERPIELPKKPVPHEQVPIKANQR